MHRKVATASQLPIQADQLKLQKLSMPSAHCSQSPIIRPPMYNRPRHYELACATPSTLGTLQPVSRNTTFP